MTQKVLMVGKSNKVMGRMARRMEVEGLSVQFTEDLDQAMETYDGRDFDAVVVGRALGDDDREKFRRTLLAQNPELAIVKSLGPYGELVAQQAKAALYDVSGARKPLSDVGFADGALRYTVSDTCRVNVTIYRHDLIWRLHIVTVADGVVEPGTHRVAIRRRQLGIGGEKFLIVTADDAQREIVEL